MINKLFNLLDSKKSEMDNLNIEIDLVAKEIVKIRNSDLKYNEIISGLTSEEFSEMLKAKLGGDEIFDVEKNEVMEQGKITNVIFKFKFNNKNLFIDIPIFHVKYRESLRFKSSYMINYGYINGCVYNNISFVSDINELSIVLKNIKNNTKNY